VRWGETVEIDSGTDPKSGFAEVAPDELEAAEIAEAATLLGRFCLLDDADAERLSILLTRCGSLSVLVGVGTALAPGTLVLEAHRLLWVVRTLLQLYAYTPEVAEILRLDPGEIGSLLDEATDLAYSEQTPAAETLIKQLFGDLADAVLAWPDATGALLATGLLQLWGDNPLWIEACGS
jgi:hypothetical protein